MTIITHTTLVDGTGAPPRSKIDIAFDEGGIREIAPSGRLTSPAPPGPAAPAPEGSAVGPNKNGGPGKYGGADTRADTVIDGTGKAVLPGLIDCHIHMDLHGYANTYEENLVEDKLRSIRAAFEMERTLCRGFTTVRNAGSVNHIDFAVKKAIEEGYCRGPRILTSGRIISMTAEGNDYFLGLYREADGPDEVRAAAREQIKGGADFLKLMATGAYMNPGGIPGAAQLEIEEMRAAVEEAEKLGLHVAAHAHGADGIKNAVRAGVRTIEHGTLIDEEGIELMREHGVYLIPTFVVPFQMSRHSEKNIADHMLDDERRDLDERLENLHRAIDGGVRICYGTDAGTPFNYHGDNARQLELFVELGFLSPVEAIHSATGAAAEAIGLDHCIGTVEPGKEADLIMIDSALLENLEGLTEGVEEVFHGGLRMPVDCI